MIEFTPEEVRDLYRNLKYSCEDLENAKACGNEETINLLEVGSDIGKAIARLESLMALVGSRVTEVPEND